MYREGIELGKLSSMNPISQQEGEYEDLDAFTDLRNSSLPYDDLHPPSQSNPPPPTPHNQEYDDLYEEYDDLHPPSQSNPPSPAPDNQGV